MEQSKTPIHITILSGGVGLREVSLSSGNALAEALQHHYSVDLVDLKESQVPEGLRSSKNRGFPGYPWDLRRKMAHCNRCSMSKGLSMREVIAKEVDSG